MELKTEIGIKHLYVTDALPVVMQPLVTLFSVFLIILFGSVWQEQKGGGSEARFPGLLVVFSVS